MTLNVQKHYRITRICTLSSLITILIASPGNTPFMLVVPKVRVNLTVVTRLGLSVKSVVQITQTPDQSNQSKIFGK